MANGRGWRCSEIFRRMAVERFKCCENIEWLAKELGVPWQTLYRWHDALERSQDGEEPPTEKSRESRLRRKINDLKRLVAEKTLEVDFFKGALPRIKARRRENGGSGERRRALFPFSRPASANKMNQRKPPPIGEPPGPSFSSTRKGPGRAQYVFPAHRREEVSRLSL
jgi:transposase-like protein